MSAPEAVSTVGRPSFAVSSTTYAGNPSCSDLGLRELKYDSGANASGLGLSSSDGYLTVSLTVTSNQQGEPSVSFTANHGVDIVLIKGGPGGNQYSYSPETMSGSGLTTPVNPDNKNGFRYGLSHVTFCYDAELGLAKTATPTFQRDWSWGVTKSLTNAADATVTLQYGQLDYSVGYSIAVSASKTDSNWLVSGTITVTNPTNEIVDATVTDEGVTLSCPSSTIAANGTLVCTYTMAPGSGADGINVASVSSTSFAITGATASAGYSFVTPTVENNECADVADAQLGVPLAARACSTGASYTGQNFSGSVNLGAMFAATCGASGEFVNTASVTPTENGAASSSSVTSAYTVTGDCGSFDIGGDPEGGACTLSQGYFKNHYTGARLDPAWATVNATTFFASGKSWIGVWTTAPAGNAYYILAHQWMAATLNVANGAIMPPAVQVAYDFGAGFFLGRNPNDTAKPKTTAAKQAAADATAAASVLQNWIMTNHCSENSPSI